ncbi:MAG: TraR/DksA C4-type zinc finger protein [Pseudomonadota bacterium]|nr:TraR/DksA C4-type zinc finger protein [Pseudomonadota bacterium]
MQTTPSLWTQPHAEPDRSHTSVIDEPMSSLLGRRLDDLERRLTDMSQTMDQLLHGGGEQPTAAATESSTAATRSLPQTGALAEVRAARERFASGRYGLCDACGSPIEHTRLVERPQVPHCGPCEDQRHP